jgi:VWFA-related protein
MLLVTAAVLMPVEPSAESATGRIRQGDSLLSGDDGLSVRAGLDAWTLLRELGPGHIVAQEQAAPQFRSDANLVVVPAVVVDESGAFRNGIDVSSFQVFEDGRSMPIDIFLPPDEAGLGTDGRFIVLVLDNLRTPFELGARVQSIARRFADRMQPGDDLSVITLSGGRANSASEPAAVRASIDRFRPALGESVRTGPELVAFGLQTIASLAEQMSRARQRRKVLVFIGSASIFSPHEPSAFGDRNAQLGSQWFDAIRATGRHNVSAYVIDPGGLTGVVDDYSDGFAEQTGGLAWSNYGDFDRTVDQIWQDSGSYYLIGYHGRADYRLHRIEVKVDIPGLTVRARRSR